VITMHRFGVGGHDLRYTSHSLIYQIPLCSQATPLEVNERMWTQACFDVSMGDVDVLTAQLKMDSLAKVRNRTPNMSIMRNCVCVRDRAVSQGRI